MSGAPSESVEKSAPVAVEETKIEESKPEQVSKEEVKSQDSNIKDVQTDDQPGEDTYKRGQNAKWTKARKADTDGRSAKKQKNAKEWCVCFGNIIIRKD